MAARYVVALLLLTAFISSKGSFDVKVLVHYPDTDSAVTACGFHFLVQASIPQGAAPVPMHRVSKDLFQANITFDDVHHLATPMIGVFANPDHSALVPECNAKCRRLEPPHPKLSQLEVHHKSDPLVQDLNIEVWPHFCSREWTTKVLSMPSPALGHEMIYTSRSPATLSENPLPRPSRALPSIIFRFNSDWFWGDMNAQDYSTWHDLMSAGILRDFVVVEIGVKNQTWTDWETVPLLTASGPRDKCPACDPELEFICSSWENSGAAMYVGTGHSYGKAQAYFDELYEVVVPAIVQQLSPRLDDDNEALDLGLWGYCVGGLAAWNGLSIRPGRFDFAYLGSPAMDYNCGEPFQLVSNFNSGNLPNRVYLDTGTAEDAMMQRQTKMLFEKMVAKGMVNGKSIFFHNEIFGTHNGRQLWQRSFAGLQALFGIDASTKAVELPVTDISVAPASSLAQKDGVTVSVWLVFALPVALAAAFVAGKKSARGHHQAVDARTPFLGS